MNFFKYIVEFIGSFIFFSVILMTGEAIPIGIALTAAIFFGGQLSGAHFNPAVSFMMLLNKKIGAEDAVGYIAAQLMAAGAAYVLLKYSKNQIVRL